MPSRNLPIAQFTAELRAETSAAIQEHAAWAGVSLAAVIVGQHRKIESLKPKEVESFRKRYQGSCSQRPRNHSRLNFFGPTHINERSS